MLRRVGIFLLLLGLLCLPAPAQDDQAEAFLSQVTGKLGSGDLEGALGLIEANPVLAKRTCALIEQAFPQMSPDQQEGAIVVVNIIARVLQVRLGDSELTQELQETGLLSPESAWDGTSLARGATTNSSASTSSSALPSGNASQGETELTQAQLNQFEREFALFLLKIGNYEPVTKVEVGRMRELTPAMKRELERFIAVAFLGMGIPTEALRRAEALAKQPADPREQLATEVLAIMAARDSGYPAQVRSHLAAARALLPRVQGDYAKLAAFLIESVAFEIDIERNPSMSVAEIKKRHEATFGLLKQLPPKAALDPATSELYWVGDLAWNAWFLHTGTRMLKATNPDEELGMMLLGDLETLGNLTRAQEDEPGARLALMTLMEGWTLVMIESERVQDAREMVGHLRTLSQLHYDQALAGDKYMQEALEPWFASLGFKFRVTDGAASYHMAQYHMLNAQLHLLEASQPYSPAVRQQFARDYQEIIRYAESGSSIELFAEIYSKYMRYLIETEPANWQSDLENVLAQFQKIPGAMEQRGSQIAFHYYRGKLRAAQNRRAEAITDFQQAVDIAEAYIREVGGGEDSGEYLRLFVSDLYTELAKAQLNKGDNPAAFDTIGRLQQMETSSVFKSDDLLPRVKSEDRVIVQRAKDQKLAIEGQERELANLKQSGAPAEKIQVASQLLAQNREAYYKTVTDLEKRYPAFEKLDIKPINFSKLQRSIPPDTLVVLLFPTEDQLYLLEATTDKLLVRQVAIKRADLEALAADFRQQMLAFSRNPRAFDWKGGEATALKSVLSRLYSVIVKPIEPDMADKKTIAFVPHGSLVYLPFQALMSENAGGGVTFLVEKKQLVVLSKAADLDQIYGPPSATTGSLVAFGNPDGSLAGATQEVKALADIFPGSQIYMEGQATEDKLKSVQAPKVSYLHLATHGTLIPSEPRESYLTMARGDKLSVSEITGYRLDSSQGDLNLVTLSACQTALAERSGASDGSDLRSLADAFSFAGCRSMVASLWKVEDNATRDLMVAFYKNLKQGQSKAAALQGAQVALLKQDKYAHPFFWAPFILIGDWR